MIQKHIAMSSCFFSPLIFSGPWLQKRPAGGDREAVCCCLWTAVGKFLDILPLHVCKMDVKSDRHCKWFKVELSICILDCFNLWVLCSYSSNLTRPVQTALKANPSNAPGPSGVDVDADAAAAARGELSRAQRSDSVKGPDRAPCERDTRIHLGY